MVAKMQWAPAQFCSGGKCPADISVLDLCHQAAVARAIPGEGRAEASAPSALSQVNIWDAGLQLHLEAQV